MFLFIRPHPQRYDWFIPNEEIAQHKSEADIITLGIEQKNEMADTSNRNEHSLQVGWPLP